MFRSLAARPPPVTRKIVAIELEPLAQQQPAAQSLQDIELRAGAGMIAAVADLPGLATAVAE